MQAREKRVSCQEMPLGLSQEEENRVVRLCSTTLMVSESESRAVLPMLGSSVEVTKQRWFAP
jgi:hypothetical protein